jgi:hypothetical protein
MEMSGRLIVMSLGGALLASYNRGWITRVTVFVLAVIRPGLVVR